jgi:hypothetical protein
VTAKNGRQSLWWPVLLAAVVVLFWVTRLVVPGRDTGLASGDLRFYFYPTYEAFYGLLARGRLLAWNPYQLCGLPWLGVPSGGFFYPPHALYLALPTHLALAASSLLHLVFIALSTMLLVRRAGLGAVAALLAALLFTLRGFVPEWVRWPSILEAGAWLPLGCVGVLDIARERTRTGLALLATATGMSLLAGGPQVTVFLLYAWATLLPALLLGGRVTRARWMTGTAAFAGGITLGTIAGAIQILPSLEVAREGTRAAREIDLAAMFPMGNPGLSVLRYAVTGSVVSFGVIGLSLAPAALLGRRNVALVLWALALGGLAFIFSLGPVTPLFRGYLALPAVTWFRTPIRIRFLSDFCFAVLVGLATDALFGERGREAPGRWTVGRPWPWVPVVCAVAIMLHAIREGAYLPALLAAGVASAVIWRQTHFAGIAVLALAGAEVFLAPATGALLPYGAAAAASYRRDAAVHAAVAGMQGASRVWLVRGALPPAWLAPRLATVYRVRSIDDYESVTLRRQAEYFTYLSEGRVRPSDPTWTFFGRVPGPPAAGPWPLTARRRLLDVAGIRFILSPANSRPMLAFVADAGLVALPAPAPGLALYENPHAVPRAYVVYHAEPAPAPDVLLARLAEPGFDPMRTSYVEGDLGPGPGSAMAGHPATIVLDEEEVVEIDATLAAPGLLVLADSYYPSWEATVDGVRVPIMPTNHLFRGVQLDSGRHRVRFEYRRGSLGLGAALSLVAVLAIGVLFARPGTAAL